MNSGTLIKLLFTFFILALTEPSFATDKIIVENLNEKMGLEKNQVSCAYQDSRGFLWFGRVNGLYRYDNTSIKNMGTSSVVNDNLLDVRDIVEYEPGILLIGTYDYGLISYNTYLETFDTLSIKSKTDFSELEINIILVENNENVWVGANDGLYWLKTSKDKKWDFEVNAHFSWPMPDLNTDRIFDIKISKDNKVWFLSMYSVGYINKTKKDVVRIPTTNANNSFAFLNNDRLLISCYKQGLTILNVTDLTMYDEWSFHDDPDITSKFVHVDANNDVWLSISGQGLLLLDSTLKYKNGTLISKRAHHPYSLNSNVIYYISETKDGTLIICTDAGINILQKKEVYFNSAPSEFDNNNGLYYGLRAINPLNENELLIGSMGKGLMHLNLKTGKTNRITLDKNNPDLAKNIQSILLDSKNQLWLGTEGDGLFRVNYRNKTQTIQPDFVNYRYSPDPRLKNNILNDFIMCLLEDANEDLWVGTWYGLSLLKKEEQFKNQQSDARFINFENKPGDSTTISSNVIFCVFQDKTGNIWVGTKNGLNKIVKEGEKYHFKSDIKDQKGNSLNSKSVIAIFQAKNGTIWFSTMDGGICKLSDDQQRFIEYNSNNGFISNTIYSIIEDNSGLLWFGTADGLCKLDPSTNAFTIFREEDGLISNVFLLDAIDKYKNKLYFGSNMGLVYFDPVEVLPEDYSKNLVFTDFKIFNKSQKVNSKEGVLKKSISYTDHIELKYNQNYITLEFSTLNFAKQKDIDFSCILEGLEERWNNLGKENKITYTNLKHGLYTFKVKAYDLGFKNKAEEISINIRIRPPFWRTKVAYIFYLLSLILGAYYLYRYLINKEKQKSQRALERYSEKKKHELDLMKLRFFMNISHEFRTPLTLIGAPLESLMKGVKEKNKRQVYYQLMAENVNKLRRLIDELLELRKIDAGYLKIVWKLGNIVDFTKRIFDTFQSYSEKRKMDFRFVSHIEELNTYFDAEKLDKVLFNLLSNAFKYTPNGGSIRLELSQYKNIHKQPMDWILIEIIDSGMGIHPESLSNIFNRFQNTEDNAPVDSASTGIGLSLVKELIDLHEGKIEVQSEEKEGSTFSVHLPIYTTLPKTADTKDTPAELESKNINSETTNNEKLFPAKKGQKPIILVVEDNKSLREFIADELNEYFEIHQCENGEEGYKQALAIVPDLVVTDIMMEKMDGISLCKKIKNDEKTSHIPVILLTARHADNVKLDSFQIGADDFITKPFSIEILSMRINNLIQQRRKLRARFSLGIDNTHTIETSNTLDSKFIEKLNDLINKNIDNSDLDATELASEMAMSRMQLYRKVKALTDQTVNNYVKTIRLNRAAQFLMSSDYQISEVAFMVGFSEPSNFTKNFSKHFNQSPTQFIQSNKKGKI